MMTGQEGFISFNIWTALLTLLNTLTLFFVLKHFLFKPVMKMIEDRQNEIDGMYADADAAKVSATALKDQYEQKLLTASETGEQLVQAAVERGRQREAEIIDKANSEAAAIMDKASAAIALEKKKALNDAKDEISDMAMAIAEKVVGRELNLQDQSKFFDEFIDELGEEV